MSGSYGSRPTATSTRPTSARAPGQTGEPCPFETGTITVYVLDEKTEEGVSEATVTLTGPAPNPRQITKNGYAVFRECNPSEEYRATVSVDGLNQYQDVKIQWLKLPGHSPQSPQFELLAGGGKYLSCSLHPPVTELLIKVVDRDKPDEAIPREQFRAVVPKANQQLLVSGNDKRLEVAPGEYKDISVDLTEQQKQLYRLVERGQANVPRGKSAEATVKLAVKQLSLVSVDHHFAPSVENLEIKYDIKNMTADDDVWLQIVSGVDDVLVERKLTEGEKQDGNGRSILWGKDDRDKVNRPGHELHGKFINPLYAPYKVKLFHNMYLPGTKELEFTVLYHSLKLEPMPWDDLYKAATGLAVLDDPGAGDAIARRLWVQYKLNKLGFWAGPLDGNDTDNVKQAIRRFCLAHPNLSGWRRDTPFYHQQGKEMVFAPEVLTDITDELARELSAGDVQGKLERPALSDPAFVSDAAKVSKLFVENHRCFVSENAEFLAANSPATKFRCEQAWLSTPHVPIRARVFLKGKNDAATDAPKAIGRAPILWSWADFTEEDLRAANLAPAIPKYKPDAPSRTADFVLQTQQKVRKGSFHGVPEEYGGLVRGTDDDAAAALHGCTRLNASTEDKPGKGVLTQAFDADPARTGIYGIPVIYLRTSTIAGDSYQVKARLCFEDLSNKDALSRSHPHVGEAQTGKLAVWRRVSLAAYVSWPARQGLNQDAEFRKMKEEFSYSLMEVDVAKCKNYTAEDLFDDALYKQVLQNARIHAAKEDGSRDPDVDGRLAHVEARGFSMDGLYKGEPEECSVAFGDFANRLMNAGDMDFRQSLAQAWLDHGNGDVQAAGKHFVKELPKPAGAPLLNPQTITAAQIEEMLLPQPAKIEIEGYAKGQSLGADFTSRLRQHLLELKHWPGDDRDKLFPVVLLEQLQTIVTASGFKPDVVPLMRSRPLDLRKWVLRRRLGSFPDYIRMKLAEKTDLLARKKLALVGEPCDGVIVLDYRVHKPVQIRGEDFITDGVAFGGLNGVVLMDHGLKSSFYSLAGHELAHCMLLQHSRNVKEAPLGNHDPADDNCMMSYPVFYRFDECNENERRALLREIVAAPTEISTFAHYCYDKFAPHFCGKCNLQLRGWKLEGVAIPAAAVPVREKPIQDVSVRLIQDKVEPDGHGKWKVVSYASQDVTSIGISFYPPNKAGAQNAGFQKFSLSGFSADFPTGFGDHEGAALDPGAFRVEVKDPNLEAKIVYVTLEALRPQYNAVGDVTGWVEFAGEERKRRSLVNVECVPIPGDPHTYRSRYLRLVVDEFDHQALAPTKQGLLVSDMVTWDSSDEADRVEILDQKLRLYYDPTP